MQDVLSIADCVLRRRALLGGVLALAAVALLRSPPAWADPPPDKIADVVARVKGSVVRITSVLPPEAPKGAGTTQAADSDPATTTAIGSGFVIDPSGLVATNRHVVENATTVFVGTPDGGRYRAELIIMAGEVDTALLRIHPDQALQAITFGDSDAVRPGDTVIAIGNPFGFAGSVSAGIVSATNRNIMESPFDDYIQTDAAINHGSSGGPLFNLSGQVIGMNSVLFAPGTYSGSAGVNFSIPSNLLRFVLPRMEKTGEVAAGRLPVRTQTVPEVMAAAIDAPGPGGALVVATTDQAETMADAIQPGDIIKAFDGAAVLDPRDLARKAAAAMVGSRVKLGFCRLGLMQTAEVPVLPFANAIPVIKRSAPPKVLGLQLAAASVDGKSSGVVVDAVDPSGSVADSGLHKGDLILRVQQQPVTTPEQALAELKARTEANHSYAALLIQHNTTQQWIPVSLPTESAEAAHTR